LIFTKETVSLNEVERGKVMEMTTSWKEEGRQEGRQEGELKLVERLLKRRCGPLSKTTKSRLQELPSGKLEKLADALLDFKSPEDIETWLYRHA
jgi:predicted transposase YdaD